jgi:hypothetical protein
MHKVHLAHTALIHTADLAILKDVISRAGLNDQEAGIIPHKVDGHWTGPLYSPIGSTQPCQPTCNCAKEVSAAYILMVSQLHHSCQQGCAYFLLPDVRPADEPLHLLCPVL